jgi:hypothetical protein
MAQTSHHVDIPSRVLGLVTFLFGVGILFFVFYLAYHLYGSPLPGLGLPAKSGTPPPAANIGIALTHFLKQVVLLAFMTLAGSIMANRGIHLYYAAAQARAAVTANPGQTPEPK